MYSLIINTRLVTAFLPVQKHSLHQLLQYRLRHYRFIATSLVTRTEQLISHRSPSAENLIHKETSRMEVSTCLDQNFLFHLDVDGKVAHVKIL
jgi:hypothetical protein